MDTLNIALPMEMGVIDLVGFMRPLREMGYDGPVMPEPFSQRLNDLAATDPEALCAKRHDQWTRSGGPPDSG